jgi:hypothetical protein
MIDRLHHAYIATARMYHLHNNPIVTFFAYSLSLSVNRNKKISQVEAEKSYVSKIRKYRNKIWLSIILRKNESLRRKKIE